MGIQNVPDIPEEFRNEPEMHSIEELSVPDFDFLLRASSSSTSPDSGPTQSSSRSTTPGSDLCKLRCLTSGPKPLCVKNGCYAIAEYECANCCSAFYCSPKHQATDWFVHRLHCLSDLIKHTELPEGKKASVLAYAVAPGDLLSVEKPLVTLPCNSSFPDLVACINCGISMEIELEQLLGADNITAEGNNCVVCRWPLCANGCVQNIPGEKLKQLHNILECLTLNELSTTDRFSWVPGQNIRYHLLWILRCIILKKRDTVRFNKLVELASFVPHEKVDYLNMVSYAKILLSLGTIAEEVTFKELESLLKVIQHRFLPMKWDVVPPRPQRKYLRSTFYQTSLIPHSCFPNADYKTDINLEQKIYALRTMAAGTALSVTYDPAGVFLTTPERRARLLKNHNIWCECERCLDVIEFGTYFSVLPCNYHTESKSNHFLWIQGRGYPKARRSEDSFAKGFSNGWNSKPCFYVSLADPHNPSKGLVCSTGGLCPGKDCLQNSTWETYEADFVANHLDRIRSLRMNTQTAAEYLTKIYERNILPCTNKLFFDQAIRIMEQLYIEIPLMEFSFITNALFLKYIVVAESVYRIFKVFHNDEITIGSAAVRVASLVRLAHLAHDLRHKVVSTVDLRNRIQQIWLLKSPIDVNKILNQGINEIFTQLRNFYMAQPTYQPPPVSSNGNTFDNVEACATAYFYSAYGDLLRERHSQAKSIAMKRND